MDDHARCPEMKGVSDAFWTEVDFESGNRKIMVGKALWVAKYGIIWRVLSRPEALHTKWLNM
jgi:hypothetical protein